MAESVNNPSVQTAPPRQANNAVSDAGQIDVVWLIGYLWAKRKNIFWAVGIGLLLGIIVCLCRPKVFSVTTSLLPVSESSAASSLKSSLGGLTNIASMVGMNLGSSSDESITPDLYYDIVTSTPSLLKLMNVPINWADPEDTVMSAIDHFRADTVMSFGKRLKLYTIGLPGLIKEAVSPSPIIIADVPEDSVADANDDKMKPIVMDRALMACAMWLQDNIEIIIDEETGLVTLTVSGDSPDQCTSLAIAVLEQMQAAITDFKTKSARKTLQAIEHRYEETLADYEKCRNEFFFYKDTHRDYVEERSDVRRQRLEDSYNLSYNLLSALQTEVETSRMQVLNSTPAFAVIEPVVRPIKKDGPKLLLHIIGGILAGGLLSVGYFIVQLGYLQVFDPKRFNAIYDEFRISDE